MSNKTADPEMEVGSHSFRSGRTTIAVYNDDDRLIARYDHCTEVKTSAWHLQFKDELGMYQEYCGFSFHIAEEV